MRTRILDRFEKYKIYNDGRVWSMSKNHFMKFPLNSDGYPQTVIINKKAKNGYRQSVTLHILVALAFVDNPNNLPEVNHKDGNKENNHYSNLEWCTRAYNIEHCHRLGLRSSRGINNGNYKTGKYVSV